MGQLVWLLFAGSFAIISNTASGQTAPTKDAHAGIVLTPAPAIYVNKVTDAAREFLGMLEDNQRIRTLMPFDSQQRVSGRDASHTPAFCAVLAWCVGWGIPQCSLSPAQQQALTRLLASALSDSGYQSVRAILNSHRIIGELEEVADSKFVGEVARQCKTLEAESVFSIPGRCLPQGKKAAPDYVAVGGAAPTDADGNYKLAWEWPNGAPGLKIRREQFCDHNIAFFGEPGSKRWAFRFEGHHLTVNLTFLRDSTNGGYRVHATPLFLGSFPIVVPPSPKPDDLEWQLTWVASQELMRETLEHGRQFIGALPAKARQAAFVAGDNFPQTPPLRNNHFPNWMLTSTLADPAGPLPFPPATIPSADLDESAMWHLRLFFRRYFDALHPAIGDRYKSMLNKLLDGNANVSVLWAGDPPEMSGGAMFLHVAIGPLLIELNADNQWSTQHRAVPMANHLHSMLRDLSFRWDYDASVRPNAPHHAR